MMYVRVDGILVLSWSFVKKYNIFTFERLNFEKWKRNVETRMKPRKMKWKMKIESSYQNWSTTTFFFFIFNINFTKNCKDKMINRIEINR